MRSRNPYKYSQYFTAPGHWGQNIEVGDELPPEHHYYYVRNDGVSIFSKMLKLIPC